MADDETEGQAARAAAVDLVQGRAMRITAPAGTRLTNQQAIRLRSALGRLADGQRMRPAARARAEGLAGTRPGGARKLGSFSVLLRKRDAVEATRSQLRRMRDLIGQTTGPVTEADKESIRESFREANAAFRLSQSMGFGRELVREFAVAGRVRAESGGLGLKGVALRGGADGGEYVIGTRSEKLGGVVLSGVLASGASYAGNSVAVTANVTEQTTFSVTTEGTTTMDADARGTLEQGGTFDGNSVVSVYTGGAPSGTVFTFRRRGGGTLELRNTVTGARQSIDLNAIAAINGTKVLTYDQLGVTITLSGPPESSNDALQKALDGATIGGLNSGSVVDGNAVSLAFTGVADGTIFSFRRDDSEL